MPDKRDIKSFEDLKVWQQTRKLRNRISGLVKDFPNEEKYKLRDQLFRASRSVTANFAEGYGRFHYQEYIQYCRQARGSLYEILDHLICAHDMDYIDGNTLSSFRQDITNCIRLLNGFISYLRKAKEEDTVQESDINYRINPDNQ